MFSLLGPGNLLDLWHLGLSSGYPYLPLPHCYTPPPNFLTLCTPPSSHPVCELVPPFPPILSPSQIPLSLYCLRLFSSP